MEEIQQQLDELKLNESFANYVIFHGLPVVPEAKHPTLVNYFQNNFMKKHLPAVAAKKVEIVLQDGSTVGVGFAEFSTEQHAKLAQAKFHGLAFDPKHTLSAIKFDDYERLTKYSEVYKEPPLPAFLDKKIDLYSWLEDPELRDQFVVRQGFETEIWWNDPVRRANADGRALSYKGERFSAEGKHWTESAVAWSPRGTYLATFHPQGIMLWGGETFELISRFKHPDVKFIDFSPQETYLVTSNGKFDDAKCIQVWDIKMGELKREFPRDFSPSWPTFKWSHDDKYFARVNENKIAVYEASTFRLLDNKPIPMPRVFDIAWSPSDYILAYWLPEEGNEAAAIGLLRVPSKTTLREGKVFTGSNLCPKRDGKDKEKDKCSRTAPCGDCKMSLEWQSNGDYLAVKLSRRIKKLQVSGSVHLFKFNDKKAKDIPWQVIDLPNQALQVQWEPNKDRFAVIHGDPTRPNVSIYEVGSKVKELGSKELVCLQNRPVSRLVWSPQGNILLLAGLGPTFTGQIEFYDVNNKETLTTIEHFSCTDVSWDPSGRYVVTSLTQAYSRGDNYFKHSMDNGYRLWTMHGEFLVKKGYETCYQVLWRPRPPRLLSDEEEKKIKATFKQKYWDKFAKEDEEWENKNLSEEKRAKKEMEAQWRKYREECIREYNEDASAREDLLGSESKEDLFVDVEEFEEQIIDEQTEKLE